MKDQQQLAAEKQEMQQQQMQQQVMGQIGQLAKSPMGEEMTSQMMEQNGNPSPEAPPSPEA